MAKDTLEHTGYFKISEDMYQAIQEHRKRHHFPSLSEFIRHLFREKLERELNTQQADASKDPEIPDSNPYFTSKPNPNPYKTS